MRAPRNGTAGKHYQVGIVSVVTEPRAVANGSKVDSTFAFRLDGQNQVTFVQMLSNRSRNRTRKSGVRFVWQTSHVEYLTRLLPLDGMKQSGTGRMT
jgi:hypothetical protein